MTRPGIRHSMILLLSSILAALVAMPASAAPPATDTIRITDAWARLGPPSSRVTGAYMKIENLGPGKDALLAASCACAETAELHVMEEKEGMMTMRQIERFDLPPGGNLELRPGGAHIMVMGLKAALEKGRSLLFELTFEQAGKIQVTVPVRDPRADAAK